MTRRFRRDANRLHQEIQEGIIEYGSSSSDRVSGIIPHQLLFALSPDLRALRADMDTPATPKPLASPVRKSPPDRAIRARKVATTVSAFN